MTVPGNGITTSASGVNDYTVTGVGYDLFRLPKGVEQVAAAQRLVGTRLRLPAKEMILLAGGCGTGNYEDALLRQLSATGDQLGKLVLVDACRVMLDQAEPKLRTHGVPLEVCQINLGAGTLPCSPGSVHHATLIEMIHHLDRGGNLHPNLKHVLAAAFDVLVPGGALTVISTTPLQSHRSRWYQSVGEWSALEAMWDPGKLYANRYPPVELLIGLLVQVGFDLSVSLPATPIPGPYITPEVYYDPAKLLEVGQKAVSFFKFAADRGLMEPYAERYHQLIASGQMANIIAQSEKWRETIGTAYCITVFKPV